MYTLHTYPSQHIYHDIYIVDFLQRTRLKFNNMLGCRLGLEEEAA